MGLDPFFVGSFISERERFMSCYVEDGEKERNEPNGVVIYLGVMSCEN